MTDLGSLPVAVVVTVVAAAAKAALHTPGLQQHIHQGCLHIHQHLVEDVAPNILATQPVYYGQLVQEVKRNPVYQAGVKQGYEQWAKALESGWSDPAPAHTYLAHYHRPTAAAAAEYAVGSFVGLLAHRNGMERLLPAVDHPCRLALDSV